MDDFQFDAAADKAFAQTHADLLKHSDIQFSFPRYERPVEPEWMKWLGHLLQQNGVALKWVVWTLAGLVVVYVIYTLVRQYWRPFWRKPAEKPRAQWPREEPWRPAPQQARQLLKEADALAAAGRYSEAVHLLLLRSIEEIEARRPRLLRRALTSREIGTLRDLPEAARPAFRGIARAVERSLFAEQPVDAAEFARCRKDYESFAFPDVWHLRAAA